MAGFEIRREHGHWTLRAQGCCGNLQALEREYERAFVEQILRAGGSIAELGLDEATLVDRKGKHHSVSAAACAGLVAARS